METGRDEALEREGEPAGAVCCVAGQKTVTSDKGTRRRT